MSLERLRHPLFGSDPRLSALCLGYVGLVGTLVALSGWRRLLFQIDGQLPAAVDTLSWWVIFLAVCSTFLVVFAYPLVNGGPGLTVLIPLGPHLSAVLSGGQIVAGVDLTLALAAAGLGGSVAVYREALRYQDSRRLVIYPGFENGIAIASAFTVFGGVSTYRLAAVAGPHTEPGVTLALAFTLLAVSGLAVLWVGYGLVVGLPDSKNVVLDLPEADS